MTAPQRPDPVPTDDAARSVPVEEVHKALIRLTTEGKSSIVRVVELEGEAARLRARAEAAERERDAHRRIIGLSGVRLSEVLARDDCPAYVASVLRHVHGWLRAAIAAEPPAG